MSSRSTSSPRIALVSVTMGRAQRGYERLFRDVFEMLRHDVDITLLKGGGDDAPQERVPSGFHTLQGLTRMVPFARVAGSEYREYKADCLAFALALLPELLADRFDIVHLIDFPLGHMLKRFRPLLRRGQKIVMTNGCLMMPQHYPEVHCIHEITEPGFRNALELGAPAERLRFATIGIQPDRFATTLSREALRRKYNVPQETFMILSVSALKRVHKRVDHLVREVSRLRGDFLLWLDGNPEDAELIAEAQHLLGARCRISLVPSSDVGELYHMADVMVHAALEEAFGLSVVEGLSTGVPVLTHCSPHFQWVTGSDDGLVDMAAEGALSARLQAMMDRRDMSPREADARARRARERFDWRVLKQQYIDLYGSLVQG